MADNMVYDAVDQATGSDAFERAARLGHGVSGVLHLLVAYIVARLASDTGAKKTFKRLKSVGLAVV